MALWISSSSKGADSTRAEPSKVAAARQTR